MAMCMVVPIHGCGPNSQVACTNMGKASIVASSYYFPGAFPRITSFSYKENTCCTAAYYVRVFPRCLPFIQLKPLFNEPAI